MMQERIERIFCNLFGVPREACGDELSPHDVETWNSVQHLTLMMSLEEEFDVQFSPEDIVELDSIGAIKAKLTQLGAA